MTNDQPKHLSDSPHTSEEILTVRKIYTKSSLFEAVAMTSSLLKTMPNVIVEVQVHSLVHKKEENDYETVLTMQLTGKHEGNLLWRVQIQQAGFYTIKGFSEEETQLILNGYCMNQLYPFASAEASRLVVQGGFPSIYLGPMNFELMYQEKLKKEKEGFLQGEPVDIIKH